MKRGIVHAHIFAILVGVLLLAIVGCGAIADPKDSEGTSIGAYQKIANKKPISILVVGDSIAEGSGAFPERLYPEDEYY